MSYTKLNTQEEIADAAKYLAEAWKDENIPQRQWDIIVNERKAVEDGKVMSISPYRTFLRALAATMISRHEDAMILEIGAASGFYYRVMTAGGFHWNYVACDYSEAFKKFSEKMIPEIRQYDVCDAANLPYEDKSFDVAVSGCCLIHMPEWKRGIAEAVRVSGNAVIFHRTPLLSTKPTTVWTKEAYGVPCIEYWFNRDEFYAELKKHNLNVIEESPVFENDFEGDKFGHYTILCER